MNTPEIKGRSADGDVHIRANTTACGGEVCGFVSGAVGETTAELFVSNDDEDRGGFVLRLTTVDQGSAFLPTADIVPGGVELCVAGDAEADAAAMLIRDAMIRFLARSRS